MEIECFCKECKTITSHDFQASIDDDMLTTISVCKKCGEATVDVGPVEEPLEMDCLGCDDSTFKIKCPGCTVDWANLEKE